MHTLNETFTLTEGNIGTNNQQQLYGALMIEEELGNRQNSLRPLSDSMQDKHVHTVQLLQQSQAPFTFTVRHGAL